MIIHPFVLKSKPLYVKYFDFTVETGKKMCYTVYDFIVKGDG